MAEQTCSSSKKVNPFTLLVNSYLLRYSMTPAKLQKLAARKCSKEKNMRKGLLHKNCIKSVNTYREWAKPKTEKKEENVSTCEESTPKAYIKIVKRKKSTQEKEETTAKRQRVDENE